MGVRPLEDDQIKIGKAVDKPEGGKDPDVRGSIASIPELELFKGNCPLWTYILAEAFYNQEKVQVPVTEKNTTITTPKLGPVGGRIVAEVFLGLMFGDNDSFLSLQPKWQPTIKADFRLRDFVNYALGQ